MQNSNFINHKMIKIIIDNLSNQCYYILGRKEQCYGIYKIWRVYEDTTGKKP